MATSRRRLERLLSRDELELIERTEKPALREAGHGDLVSLRSTLRERRDRARSIARQQRREMRGKSEPRGARPAEGNLGTIGKHDTLTSALKRLGNELRRREQSSRVSQRTIARRALAMKKAAPPTSTQPEHRTAGEGMHNVPREGQAPSGAFDHAGMQPAMQRAKFARQ